MSDNKPRLAVHKFSSCDGCQLAFLNLGPALIELSRQADIVHFVEAGPDAAYDDVDIAFIEGSISTARDLARIKDIRQHSQYLVTIGACATSGGIQALRNLSNTPGWTKAIYASPEYIDSLDQVTPIAEQVKVDFERWGCPVSSRQIIAAVRSLLFGVPPLDQTEKVCLECKRQQHTCVLVTQQARCLGPVTRTGCGALCPAFGRACYACYGPAETAQGERLAQRFAGLGMAHNDIADRFQLIYSQTDDFAKVAASYRQTGKHQDVGHDGD